MHPRADAHLPAPERSSGTVPGFTAVREVPKFFDMKTHVVFFKCEKSPEKPMKQGVKQGLFPRENGGKTGAKPGLKHQFSQKVFFVVTFVTMMLATKN